MKNKEPIIINNISDLSKLMGYAESRHPLIDIIEFVPGKIGVLPTEGRSFLICTA